MPPYQRKGPGSVPGTGDIAERPWERTSVEFPRERAHAPQRLARLRPGGPAGLRRDRAVPRLRAARRDRGGAGRGPGQPGPHPALAADRGRGRDRGDRPAGRLRDRAADGGPHLRPPAAGPHPRRGGPGPHRAARAGRPGRAGRPVRGHPAGADAGRRGRGPGALPDVRDLQPDRRRDLGRGLQPAGLPGRVGVHGHRAPGRRRAGHRGRGAGRRRAGGLGRAPPPPRAQHPGRARH